MEMSVSVYRSDGKWCISIVKEYCSTGWPLYDQHEFEMKILMAVSKSDRK